MASCIGTQGLQPFQQRVTKNHNNNNKQKVHDYVYEVYTM